jgi:hypothetical protein
MLDCWASARRTAARHRLIVHQQPLASYSTGGATPSGWFIAVLGEYVAMSAVVTQRSTTTQHTAPTYRKPRSPDPARWCDSLSHAGIQALAPSRPMPVNSTPLRQRQNDTLRKKTSTEGVRHSRPVRGRQPAALASTVIAGAGQQNAADGGTLAFSPPPPAVNSVDSDHHAMELRVHMLYDDDGRSLGRPAPSPAQPGRRQTADHRLVPPTRAPERRSVC